MKNFVPAAVISCLLILMTGCSHKTYPTGNYQETPVTADGKLDEWSTPLRFGSSTGLVQYNVTNDADNIYISLETHDEATAVKILKAGMNIYIDPNAEKSKHICLSFPLPNTVSLHPEGTDKTEKPAKGEFMQALLIQAVEYNASGFKNMENRRYDVSDKSAIKVGINSVMNKSLGYEVVIPLKYIFQDAAARKDAHNISVGIVINPMKGGSEMHAARGGGSGMHSGGRGGGSGGGRGMGSGGGSYHKNSGSAEHDPGTETPGNSSVAKEDVNWYTFTLASKK